MPTAIFQTQYRDENVAAFEQTISRFRMAAAGSYVDERVIKGNVARILVGGSGSATMSTRGVDGNLVKSKSSYSAVNITLTDFYRREDVDDFDQFASQGNLRQQAVKSNVAAANRKIDDVLIAALTTGTQELDASAAITTLDRLAAAQAELGEQDVDVEDEKAMFCAVSHKAYAKLIQIAEFASADYVNMKLFDGPSLRFKNWMGINFFKTNRLPGVGTATETMFMWHRDALGFADNREGIKTEVGRVPGNFSTYQAIELDIGAAVLQNTGIIKIYNIGT